MIRIVLCSALIVTTAAAQSVIVPSAAATTRPSSPTFYTSAVFYGTTSTTTAPDSHAQLIYDMNDVQVLGGGAVWNSLQVRRPQGLGNNNPASTMNATIMMSISPLAYTAMTNTFASNHGPMPTTVLSGPISLPNQPNPGSWPAPWEAPFPFSSTFGFVTTSGLSVVVDIMQTGNTGGSSWYLEAQYPDTGNRVSNPSAQSSCRFSNGKYNNVIGWQRPRLGNVWYVNYQGGLPTGMVGIGALGFVGVGGTWNGLPLPIDLAPFGAPGCSWNVRPSITVPLTSTTAVYQWPPITIPNNPILGGQSFYDHAMFVDPPANPWGVVTTWSSRWIIGTNQGAPAAMLYATGNNAANPTGTLSLETGVSLQLNP